MMDLRHHLHTPAKIATKKPETRSLHLEYVPFS